MPRYPNEAPLQQRLVASAVDVVGDVHGCLVTLGRLLEQLGYTLTWAARAESAPGRWIARAVHPEGRVLVFVGDLVDRGADPLGVLRSVYALTTGPDGHAMVLGNHDLAAMHCLNGTVKMGHRFWVERATREALEALGPVDVAGSERATLGAWLKARPVVIRVAPAGGRRTAVVVTHAGWPLRWRLSVAWNDRERVPWGIMTQYQRELVQMLAAAPAADWQPADWPEWVGDRMEARRGPWVVVGHTPLADALVYGRLAMIDTGACYGGALTAFQWPECATLRVSAQSRDVAQVAAGEVAHNGD